MRVWKQKRGSMQHYDKQATIYNVHYLVEQNAKIETMLSRMTFRRNEKVLDLGCGTGFLFPYLAQKAEFLVGLDISKKVLHEAKKRARGHLNIHIIRADADTTPFLGGIFNKILSITVLQNMPKPKKTITEMKRTAKAEAIFAVTGLKKKFTEERFVNLLENGKLKVLSLNTDEQLKGYVAICKNL